MGCPKSKVIDAFSEGHNHDPEGPATEDTRSFYHGKIWELLSSSKMNLLDFQEILYCGSTRNGHCCIKNNAVLCLHRTLHFFICKVQRVEKLRHRPQPYLQFMLCSPEPCSPYLKFIFCSLENEFCW